MTKIGTEQESAAPLGSVDVGQLVFTRGAAHLTIGVDGSMEDLIRLDSRARCRTSVSTEAR